MVIVIKIYSSHFYRLHQMHHTTSPHPLRTTGLIDKCDFYIYWNPRVSCLNLCTYQYITYTCACVCVCDIFMIIEQGTVVKSLKFLRRSALTNITKLISVEIHVYKKICIYIQQNNFRSHAEPWLERNVRAWL